MTSPVYENNHSSIDIQPVYIIILKQIQRLEYRQIC